MEDNVENLSCASSYEFSFSQKVYLKIKRLFDIIISFITLIVLFPVFLIAAIAIKATSKGSVLFLQNRVGLNGKTIKMYKFRTMIENSPENAPTGQLESPHTYITKVGKILRLTSIDEMPQFINVLKGEMSLIGPRPLILNETDAHTLRHKNSVYMIRPGITGLAQVNGRDCINIEKKVAFDTAYLHSLSFSMDLYIILKSIVVVFSHADFFEGKKEK